MRFFAKPIALALLAVAASPFTAANANVIDDLGDFLPSYTPTAPRTGDLDISTADVIFDGTNFILSATVNGMIGTTANTLYVWGFNRGGAVNAPFTGIGEPNVIFDAVVTVNGTTGVVGGSPGVTGTSSISGNSITATIAASTLTSTGAAFSDYLWNLWSRVAATSGGGSQPIPDFAPENRMEHVSVPEPASLTLLGMGLVGLGWRSRKRAGKRA